MPSDNTVAVYMAPPPDWDQWKRQTLVPYLPGATITPVTHLEHEALKARVQVLEGQLQVLAAAVRGIAAGINKQRKQKRRARK